MITVIYGAKGSGKTKRIIDAANQAVEAASGHVVFLTDNNESLGINPSVRFVNLHEDKVESEEQFIGFVKGMIATNFDIQQVFIDGLGRLFGKSPAELEDVYKMLTDSDSDIMFTVTVSSDKLPEYLKEYANG